ncbi:MAG: hypothetical protein L0H38_03355 [bacterium]|nr:hypothetical protein [bacterium]
MRIGRLTGNDKLAAQGKTDQRIGKIKDHAKNSRNNSKQKA